MKLLLTLLCSLSTACALNFTIVASYESQYAWDEQTALENAKGSTRSVRMENRIVGGTDAPDGRYPYYTYIEVLTNQGVFFCSATLIWQDMLLTAAHCLLDLQQEEGLILQGLDAFVGLEQTTARGDSIYRQVDEAIPHPNYNAITLENDVMLFHMVDPILTIQPVQLNFNDAVPINFQRVDVFGFGQTTESEVTPLPTTLQTVDVNVIPFADCNDANSFDGEINNDLMICAGIPAGGRVSPAMKYRSFMHAF